MDRNSYDQQGSRYSIDPHPPSSGYGVDFLLGAWWTECLVWDQSSWHNQECYPLNSSIWETTHCLCASYSTIYGSTIEPLLTEEDKMAVNDLMLVSTFVALYSMIGLLAFYSVAFVLLYNREKEMTKRRNVWLKDNRPSHAHAYLLTINTGTQRNAGTFATVFAILNGTKAMSKTSELQSRQETLFTRGSVCSFILTSIVPLGDILSVQLWHNDYSRGKGWYVCEVSVADLQTGSTFVYPCYKWLSVTSEDGQVVREVTLEKPTTFMQDFEHFLPQYVGEHTLWYSLFSTTNSKKFYKLQNLTIFLTFCLLLGTVSLNVVKHINSSHTMMTPDPHIETLYYGFIVIVVLLPAQWILRLVFKLSNMFEERVFYNRIVKNMIKKRHQENTTTPNPKKDPKQFKHKFNIDEDEEFFNVNSEFWQTVSKFAKSFGPVGVDESIVHPTFAKMVQENNANELRRRRVSNTSNEGKDQNVFVPKQEETRMEQGQERKRSDDCVIMMNGDNETNASKEQTNTKMMTEQNNFFLSAAISMSVGWMISLTCVVICLILLLNEGPEMAKDYSSLWLQTVFIGSCASIFIVQPCVITLFTLYKVCVYRIFGSRGLWQFWPPIPLGQAITVWNHYKEILKDEKEEEENEEEDEESRIKKKMQNIERERYLRFAHPPPENVLIQHRNRLIISRKISSIIKTTICYISFFLLLILILYNFNLQERFYLNKTIKDSASNGSCIDKQSLLYKSFSNITTKEDWWNWSVTEFLDLTFNYDSNYSEYKIFCDTNSIIIGTPRIRMYEVKSEACEADNVQIHNSNESLAEIYEINGCYPDYKNNASHVYGFSKSNNPQNSWDAHYLSVIHGRFSDYSYTSNEIMLPNNRFEAFLFLLYLQFTEGLKRHTKLRAIVTEFTLFHPESSLYSAVEFVAEFPSISGANNTIDVSSTFLNRQTTYLIYALKHGEFILIAVAMFNLRKTCIQLYKNKGRFWVTFWSVLDFFTTILCWIYVIFEMLRVHIVEDLLWEMKVTYYQKFVNIKSLVSWDNILCGILGFLIAIHMLRFLRLLMFIPKYRMFGEVLYKGVKESLKYSAGIFFLIIICGNFGNMWFGSYFDVFSTLSKSYVTLLETLTFRTTFYKVFIDNSTSPQFLMANLFFTLVFFLLFFMIFGVYKAIFIYTKKNYVCHPRSFEITSKDLLLYFERKWDSFKGWFSKTESIPVPEDDFKEHSFNLYISEMESLIDTLKVKVDSICETLDISLYEKINNDLLNIKNNKTSNGSDFDEDLRSSSSLSLPQLLTSDQANEEIEGAFNENENPKINLSALDDILSCPSELNPSTIYLLSELFKKEQNERDPIQAIDNSDHISKFLKDVATASTDHQHIFSHGKYGKSVPKMKSKGFLSFFSENSLHEDMQEEPVAEAKNQDCSEEEFYFSPVPVPFDGMEELLAKYGNDESFEEN